MTVFRLMQNTILALLPACLLFSANADAAAQTSIQVLSATVKDQAIPNAEVIFQKNGHNSVSGRTDSHGKTSIVTGFGSDDNSVLLIVKAAGYSTLVVKCPCNGLTYALSKTMTQLDGMRIVLTWGKHPLDLDSHLVFPGNNIFFQHKRGDHAWLDVDSQDGYGPETITIDRRLSGKPYLYAVHTYADRNNDRAAISGSISDTEAKVQVYVGSSLVRTYYFMPRKVNTLLVLFGINKQGEIYDINKYRYNVTGFTPRNVFTANGSNDMVSRILTHDLGAATYTPTRYEINQNNVSLAIQLNHNGEAAYHRHELSTAIDLYRRAIDLNPGYGQAYSNLGLAYQKTGRIAEALWANRRAIVLATGARRNIVRASSYYNIARIYEKQGYWQQALQNYQWAEALHHNKVYTKAMARMRARLN